MPARDGKKSSKEFLLPLPSVPYLLLADLRSQGLDGPFGIVTKTIGRHLILDDLRRTFRSIAEATGVTEHQRKWLINHSTKNDVDLSYVGLSDAAIAAAVEKRH